MHPLLLVIMILFLPVTRLHTQQQLIDWSTERKLTWDDFKASPDQNSPNAALTYAAIKMEYHYGDGVLVYHLRCLFDQKASWGRVKNDYILSHEQGHFDIAEWYTRKLNKSLQEYKPNVSRLAKDVGDIYQQIMQQFHQEQQQYDEQTHFSLDQDKQALWLKKINTALNQLKDYANYRH